MIRIHSVLVPLLLMLAFATSAESQIRLTNPERLDPNSERGSRVVEFMQIVLTGDGLAIREHLQPRTAGALAFPDTLDAQLARLIAAVGEDGAYLVDAVFAAGDRMALVRLGHTRDGDPLTVLVETEAAPPFRFTSLRVASTQMRILRSGEPIPRFPPEPSF